MISLPKMNRLILLSISILALSSGSLAYAAVTNPYTVDEKPQVLFGDSTSVLGHLGLENYVQDIVGGYIHITFTYTHSRCCFANFPPSVYITNTDPRATTTAIVKSLLPLYRLLPIPIPPGHETDWYSYDIQFDAAGYRTVVKERGEIEIANVYTEVSGLAEGDWVSLANRYPDLYVSPSMSFTPIQTLHASPPPEIIDPVIIIPGIMGSYLNKDDGTEVWLNLPKIILPGDDSYLDELSLDTNGVSINTITPTDIIRETNVPLFSKNFFQGLIEVLTGDSYVENNNLYVFSYDWRLDIVENISRLNNKISEVLLDTNADKVDIIAHSMGGLLVKSYIDSIGSDHINKFIDVASPHIGSPKSFITLSYGDVGIAILNKDRIKAISQNMPSVYELLPSASYINQNGSYLYDLDDFDSNTVRGPLSYTDTKEFMKNTGRNSALVDRADVFHQEIDDLNPADYGVKTYNIVGCGTPTLGKIFIVNKEDSGGVEYNISYVNGDGTVPLKSAEAMSADRTYYVKNAVHALMPSTTGVKELVRDILSSTSTEPIDISSYSNIASTATGCNIPNGKIVSFHSPIDLHIYQGDNHTGPDSNGDIEYNIPGVIYEVVDGNKFAFLPDGVNYTVKGTSSGEGTFSVRIENIESENVVETKYFSSIPLVSTTQVEVGINTISVDNDGDGDFESLIFSDDTDLEYLINYLKNQIRDLDIDNRLEKKLLKKVESLEKKIEKKQKKNKSLDGLAKKINNIIDAVNKKNKKGKISDIDTQGIINLLEQIENKL